MLFNSKIVHLAHTINSTVLCDYVSRLHVDFRIVMYDTSKARIKLVYNIKSFKNISAISCNLL